MRFAFSTTRRFPSLFQRPLLEALEERCVPAGGAPSPIPVVTTGAVGSSFVPDTNNLKVFPPSDDDSICVSNIGFTIDVGGVCYHSLYINNNGSVTFGAPFGTPYTPEPLSDTGVSILAPFFADVSTIDGPVTVNGQQYANTVTYGPGTVDGHAAFAVTWDQVDYYHSQSQTDSFDTFQVVLVQRTDLDSANHTTGSFDFEFNYNTITWETGDASGGTNGLGGTSARVGYSINVNGKDGGIGTNPVIGEDQANLSFQPDGVVSLPTTDSYEFPGSGANGALLDSNAATGLVNGQRNSSIPGQYVFHVTNGVVAAAQDLPPVFTTAPTAVTINEGQSVSTQFLATTSSDQLPITYSLVPTTNLGPGNSTNAIPAGMSIDSHGLLAWPASAIPPEIEDTTYSVTVRAADIEGNFTDTNFLITVLAANSGNYKTATLSPGQTGSISLPNSTLTISEVAGVPGQLQCGLGTYTKNPSGVPLPGGPANFWVDVWVENPDLLNTVTVTLQTPIGSGPFILRYLDSTSKAFVPADAVIFDDPATGRLTITFKPPYTEFNFTVFAVSLANAIVQPTTITPPTVLANTNASTASDVSPALVQTINFISSTQLTVTVSAAQDSQQIATLTSQGSRAVAAAEAVGPFVSLRGEGDLQALEPLAWWFQFGDEIPLLPIGPQPQQNKPAVPKTPVPKPGNDETSSGQLDLSVDSPESPRLESDQAAFTELHSFPAFSEYEFRSLALPPFAIAETPAPEKPPVSPLALPLLVLGDRLVRKYRDKERARPPGFFRKVSQRVKEQRDQKKKKAQKKKRVQRFQRQKAETPARWSLGPTWILVAFFLFALLALV